MSGQPVANETVNPVGGMSEEEKRTAGKKKTKREECPREHDPRALTEQKDTKPASEAEPDKKPNEEEQEMAINGNHMLYTTKYGSEVLLGMKTKVSRIRTPLKHTSNCVKRPWERGDGWGSGGPEGSGHPPQGPP